MSGGPSEETLKRARLWCARQFSARYDRASHASHLACEILREADKRFALESFGDEGFCDHNGNAGISYLNMGDSYTRTLVAKTDRRSATFKVGCWADFADPEGTE